MYLNEFFEKWRIDCELQRIVFKIKATNSRIDLTRLKVNGRPNRNIFVQGDGVIQLSSLKSLPVILNSMIRIMS